jgi:PadR family transcriptional regulator PadR
MLTRNPTIHSRVRCATSYEVTPYGPSAGNTRASAPSTVRGRQEVALSRFVLQRRAMTLAAVGSLELTILVAVSRLGADAYGLAIRGDVSARTGHDYSVGAIYTTLHRLEEKGLVTSRVAEPLPVRGGRARREFKLTAAGRRALRDARRVAASVWAGVIPPFRPEPA